MSTYKEVGNLKETAYKNFIAQLKQKNLPHKEYEKTVKEWCKKNKD